MILPILVRWHLYTESSPRRHGTRASTTMVLTKVSCNFLPSPDEQQTTVSTDCKSLENGSNQKLFIQQSCSLGQTPILDWEMACDPMITGCLGGEADFLENIHMKGMVFERHECKARRPPVPCLIGTKHLSKAILVNRCIAFIERKISWWW